MSWRVAILTLPLAMNVSHYSLHFYFLAYIVEYGVFLSYLVVVPIPSDGEIEISTSTLFHCRVKASMIETKSSIL